MTHPDPIKAEAERPRTDPLDLWLNTSRSADEPGACALCELPWTKGQWIGTVRIGSRTFWCHVACANRYRPTSNQARHRKATAR